MACARGRAAALARARAAGIEPLRDLPADPTAENTDVLHYWLELGIDPATRRLAGSNTITVKSRVDGLDRMVIRLWAGFTISAVSVDGAAASWRWLDGESMEITLPHVLAADMEFNLAVAYEGMPLGGGMGSIYFTSQAGQPVVFTLSEPWFAYTWWPVKEDNRDKATADLLFTVPSSMVVASNGTLVGVDTLSGGRKRYHWATSYPASPYLYCFAATNYSTFGGTFLYSGGSMPVQFFVYPTADTPANRAAWLKTVGMLGVFSDLFGLYPFTEEKYGIYQFSFGGGMEHQTMTGQGAFNEDLTSHELSHQWWGDLVTCATWHDIWLNEGFATYAEALWQEYKGGDDDREALKWMMLNLRPARVLGTVYCYDISDVDRIFSWDYSYAKGGWVLHMLRHVIGDARFFDLLALYRERFAFSTLTTEQFVALCEEVAGQELSWFFDEWVYGGGAPTYAYGTRELMIAGGNYLELYLEQTQTVQYGVFTMPIDVTVTSPGGTSTEVVWNDAQAEHFLLPVTGPAGTVTIDPSSWILSQGTTAIPFVEGPPKVVATWPEPGARASTDEATRIIIDFQEPVTASVGDFELAGLRRGPIGVVVSTEEGGSRVVLTPQSPLPADTYRLTISQAVTGGANGMALDGEVSNPVDPSALPSGDGLPGGSAVVRFDVVRAPRPRVHSS